MRTIEQYHQEIGKNWPDGQRAAIESDEALKLCLEAILVYPETAKFHVLKGCLIQLGSIESEYTLEDAEASFLKALEVDPTCEDACRELGHFYYAVSPDEDLCRKYFALAEKLAT